MTGTSLTASERYDVGRFVYSIRGVHTYRRTWPIISTITALVIWRVWATWDDSSMHGTHIFFVTIAALGVFGMSANWFIRQAQLLVTHVEESTR
jgi:hypothetical protein